MEKTKASTNSSRSARGKKALGIGLLLALFTGLGVAVFGRKPKGPNFIPTPPPKPKEIPGNVPKPRTGSRPAEGFPLRRGMKGELVHRMQEGLQSRSPGILARYGADADFGGETEAALQKLGFPVVVDKASFERIVSASPAKSGGAKAAALSLINALSVKNFPAGISVLRSISGPAAFGELDRELRRLPGSPNAIGTIHYLLGANSPLSHSERQSLSGELLRIGLVQDRARGTWALPFSGGGRSANDF